MISQSISRHAQALFVCRIFRREEFPNFLLLHRNNRIQRKFLSRKLTYCQIDMFRHCSLFYLIFINYSMIRESILPTRDLLVKYLSLVDRNKFYTYVNLEAVEEVRIAFSSHLSISNALHDRISPCAAHSTNLHLTFPAPVFLLTAATRHCFC